VRPGFSQTGYDGSEGPDRRSTLPNIPCHVVIHLKDTRIETSLTLRLIPRTFPENVAANGPQPSPCTAEFKEANASSKNMSLVLHLFLYHTTDLYPMLSSFRRERQPALVLPEN